MLIQWKVPVYFSQILELQNEISKTSALFERRLYPLSYLSTRCYESRLYSVSYSFTKTYLIPADRMSAARQICVIKPYFLSSGDVIKFHVINGAKRQVEKGVDWHGK